MSRQTHCSCGNPFRYQMDRLRDRCRECREVRWLALKAAANVDVDVDAQSETASELGEFKRAG